MLAKRQTHGQGRLGNNWYSPYGGLWLTLAFKEESKKEPRKFVFASAVALIFTIREFCHLNPEIRIPNDIYLNGKKLAGILIKKEKGAFFLGVGINTNLRKFPEILKDKATSLLKNGCEVKNLLFAEKFVDHFFEFKSKERATFELYRKYTEGIGKKVRFEYKNSSYKGIFEGITITGKVRIFMQKETQEFDLDFIRNFRFIKTI